MPDEGTPPQGTEGNDPATKGLLASLGLRRTEEPATGSTEQPKQEEPKAPPAQEPPKEPLGDTGMSALERERDARREAERSLTTYKEQVEFEQAQASRSERQKLEAERDRYRSKAESSEKTLLRVRVAATKNLTPGLALRLQGDTEAEMVADADRLLEEVGGLPTRTGFDGGARQPAAAADSPEEAHRKLILGLLGRQPDQPT